MKPAVADFCSTFAFSDPDDDNFSTTKTTLTDLKCMECRLLVETIDDIVATVQEADYLNSGGKS